jgi:hypothetical protein
LDLEHGLLSLEDKWINGTSRLAHDDKEEQPNRAGFDRIHAWAHAPLHSDWYCRTSNSTE